jgi:hypothetical protein
MMLQYEVRMKVHAMLMSAVWGCGAQVRVAAKSGVISSIDTAGDYAGFPAVCPVLLSLYLTA